MEKKIITRALIESAVDHELKNMESNPKRTLRKLADMGKLFSTGRFSQWNFDMIQKMLQNEDSPYYTIIEHLVKNNDLNNLKYFCTNIGYESWVYNARILRDNCSKLKCAIPWMVIFHYNPELKDSLSKKKLKDFIESATKLGINTFSFIQEGVSGTSDELADIFEKFPTCGFFYFLPDSKIDLAYASRLKKCKNVMISINAKDKNCLDACAALRQFGSLFAIHYKYNDDDLKNTDAVKVLESCYSSQSPMLFTIQDDNCKNNISASVTDLRLHQTYPIFLWDLYSDVRSISEMICDQSSILRIKPNGFLQEPNINISIKNDSLENILKESMPKITNIA
ncbi:MAG: hypothetical protein K6B41_06145 [Butyrivibrio sp.]|nr:hypothetical protein [Butyrivibrio sp.]